MSGYFREIREMQFSTLRSNDFPSLGLKPVPRDPQSAKIEPPVPITAVKPTRALKLVESSLSKTADKKRPYKHVPQNLHFKAFTKVDVNQIVQ